jgi:hypothetical protein
MAHLCRLLLIVAEIGLMLCLAGAAWLFPSWCAPLGFAAHDVKTRMRRWVEFAKGDSLRSGNDADENKRSS